MGVSTMGVSTMGVSTIGVSRSIRACARHYRSEAEADRHLWACTLGRGMLADVVG
jgi:hypothetical protein